MPELTRESLIKCINSRHHYATTGGSSGRMRLSVSMSFDEPATQYLEDPMIVKDCKTKTCLEAIMGDIVHLPVGNSNLKVSVDAASPVRCIDIFNGLKHLECYRPYAESDLGDRIGVLWEGAEYRGRFRAVSWDGSAHFDKAKILSTYAVNFFNCDKTIDSLSNSDLAWKSVTTGNFAGFIAKLNDSRSGSIEIKTELINETMALADVGYKDTILDASDILPRGIRLFRLPNENTYNSASLERKLEPHMGKDNPFYVRISLEDGTQAWSSPIYVLRKV